MTARPLSRRALLTALGASATLAAVSGCGSGVLPSPDISRPGFGTDGRGTVRLWVRAATQAGSTPIVERFNRSHPELQVELTAIPETQYITKLATAIRGRQVPDVVDVDDINSTLLAYHQALTDITPLVEDLPYRRQLSKAHLDLATYEDRTYAVPYIADVSLLYYNKRLFEDAGLDPERPPGSLDDMLEAARRVAEIGDDVVGFSFGGNDPGIVGFTVLPSVWASRDYTFVGELGDQRANIEDNPAMRKTLEVYRALWQEGLSSATSRTETGATWGKDFVGGTVGLWPGNEGALIASGVSPELARDVGVVALPGAVGGSSTFAGGDNLAIPRGATNASGAWEFIRYALETEQQVTLPDAGYTPVRTDAATPEFVRAYPRTTVGLEALPRGYAPQTLAYNTAVNQVGGPNFQMFTTAVFGAGVDPALRSGQEGFERALLQAAS